MENTWDKITRINIALDEIESTVNTVGKGFTDTVEGGTNAVNNMIDTLEFW